MNGQNESMQVWAKPHSPMFNKLSPILLGVDYHGNVVAAVPSTDIEMNFYTEWLQDAEIEFISRQRVVSGYPEIYKVAYLGNGSWKRVSGGLEKKNVESQNQGTLAKYTDWLAAGGLNSSGIINYRQVTGQDRRFESYKKTLQTPADYDDSSVSAEGEAYLKSHSF